MGSTIFSTNLTSKTLHQWSFRKLKIHTTDSGHNLDNIDTILTGIKDSLACMVGLLGVSKIFINTISTWKNEVEDTMSTWKNEVKDQK